MPNSDNQPAQAGQAPPPPPPPESPPPAPSDEEVVAALIGWESKGGDPRVSDILDELIGEVDEP
jgi:hypothetical protein